MDGPVFHPVDEATKARYEILGQDLYVHLDVNYLNSQVDAQADAKVPFKNQDSKAEADLIMSMLQDGYDPLQLTLEERRTLVQYFDLRLLGDFIKDDVLQDREDNSKVPLDTTTKERDLTKVTRHTKGGS